MCNSNLAVAGDLSVFFSEADNSFTIGITLAPLYQRQGFAYELLRELIGQMQQRYPSTDIVALIEKENTPSISLFQKLGFIEECYADSIQSYVFTIYGKADWSPRRFAISSNVRDYAHCTVGLQLKETHI